MVFQGGTSIWIQNFNPCSCNENEDALRRGSQLFPDLIFKKF